MWAATAPKAQAVLLAMPHTEKVLRVTIAATADHPNVGRQATAPPECQSLLPAPF